MSNELRVSKADGARRMKHQLTFRYAAGADFEAVLELACQLASQIEAKVPPLTAEQFEAYYVSAHAPMRLLLAAHDSRIVGMISWTLTHELYSADTRVYISDVSVDHAARGQGVGAALMAQVKAWARAHNASKLGWEVWHRNFAAKAFYERLGASIDEEAIPYVMALEDEEL
jgi:GNAT superfamily N-acetyltransferase